MDKPAYEKTISQKIIFLDIDGVLNSSSWNAVHQMEICDGTLVDKDKICLLAKLVKETTAALVLHSGWRFWFDKDLKPVRNLACDSLPCDVWRATKDPSLSEQQFEATIQERVDNLKGK